MKIFALLSFFDEDPVHLARCVSSLKGFADVLIAVDGAYATFPDGAGESPAAQRTALINAAEAADLGVWMLRGPAELWAGEVAKRAAMFEYGRMAGATEADWFLIIDADMTLAEHSPDARVWLNATDMDVAEVRWHDMQIDGKPCSTMTFRSMFRALPGLTVERAHYLYTTPCDDCKGAGMACNGTGRRFLWHTPDGHISKEAQPLDLTHAVTLHHYNSQRYHDRKQRALRYYQDRDAARLESVGDWR